MIILAIYGDGRFDSRPIETDEYLLMAGLYIEKTLAEAKIAEEGLLVDTDPLYYEMRATPEKRRSHYLELKWRGWSHNCLRNKVLEKDETVLF